MTSVLRRYIGKYISELRVIKASPKDIAKAFSVGIFLGILPGTGLVAALFVAVLFKLNKTAVALGALSHNPWTSPLIYIASYKIGHWIIKNRIDIPLHELFTWQGFTFKRLGVVISPFLLGGFILALSISILCYVLVYAALNAYASRSDGQVH